MGQDDTLDKDHNHLDQEIDSKVDSLFVEGGEGEEVAAASPEGDHLKGLKEHFLALEWEIDMGTVENILKEINSLRDRYAEGPLALLLGWMQQIAERIRSQGSDLDQDTVKLFHRIKDGFLQFAENPAEDSGTITEPLREEIERLFGAAEEEEPTITLDTAAGEEEILFEELDRIMEEPSASGDESVSEEKLISEAAMDSGERIKPMQETLEEETPRTQDEVEDTALESAEEYSWEMESAEEVPTGEGLVDAGQETQRQTGVDELDEIRKALAESGLELQRLLGTLQGPEGPLGLNTLLEDIRQRLKDFTSTLANAVQSTSERIQSLEDIEQLVKPVEQEPAAEPAVHSETVLFVSVSNRIFGIPQRAVKSIHRLPGDAARQLKGMTEIQLKGKTVPIVPLWRKLGLGKEVYTFPLEEKRILLVESSSGELGLVVDRVLAREEVPLKPVQEDQVLFKGVVAVEKWAFVVDPEAL